MFPCIKYRKWTAMGGLQYLPVVVVALLCSIVIAQNRSSLCVSIEIEEGLGKFAHPTLCTKYMECDVGRLLYIRSCPDGLFYDPTLITCVFPYDINCPNDPCFRGDIAAYAMETDSCMQYFVCKDGWTYERQCCGKGLAFDGSRGCKIDASCNSTCDDEITTVAQKPDDCFNLPDPKNKSQYIVIDHGNPVTMPCAPGSLYDVAMCECSILDLAYQIRMGNSVCTPTLKLDFRGGKIGSFEDKSGQWSYVKNQGVSLSDAPSYSGDNRSALFRGGDRESIILPRFTFSEFIPRLTINIVFKLSESVTFDDKRSEALVTNSDSDACVGSRPSVSLTVNRASHVVRAVVHTVLPQEIVVSNSNLYLNDWNELTLTFDGESVLLLLNYLPVKTHPTGNPAKLEPVQCALHIGSGISKATFSGLIDSFELILC